MNPPIVANPRLITDLEALLEQLILEHRKLLKHIEDQQAAMKVLNLKAMDQATQLQEASRLRVAGMDHRRRTIVLQIGKSLRLAGEPKIQQLADHFPHRKTALLKLRADLRQAITEVSTRNHVAGKVAGAVLGHLNTAVRLFAGAVEHAGLYNKQGMPRIAKRIGVMEAVG